MKRSITTFVAALTMIQSSAYADIVDLPNPFDGGDSAPEVPRVETPTPPAAPVQTQYIGSVTVAGMSRKSGGTVYRINLNKAQSLSRLDVRVTKNQLKVLQTTLLTDNGQRVSVRQLSSTNVLATGSLNSSEVLNQSDRVVAIEILAESFGGEAEIIVTAVADREVPKLTLVPQEKKPVTPPAPPASSETRVENYNRNLREGDEVMVMDREYAKAVVVGFDNNGNHILRFTTGELRGRVGGGWLRENLSLMSGCTKEYCVGQLVFNKSRDNMQVKVVAVQFHGSVIIEFMEGELKGRLGGNWNSDELTLPKKCGSKFCIEDKAYLLNGDKFQGKVLILGVDKNDRYSVYFYDGELAGRRGHNWSKEDLAKISGCGRNFCVGDVVTNITRDYAKVQVMGIQENGRYVLKFLEGQVAGRFGHNWEDSDLRKFRY
ncbi:beta-sandwich domain-containing protein [Bdellovibrio sp. 22V]|uniref:beta-sandwich domain-containing protein n=1 Tax=Bdellovibrio TaxID=958 RepID=UPI0025431304|nr:beta-sandwich domain-containing protein [Bdellovibrio sp. 22V]WII71253.1 beta-sandwich domain-containing protein [Bdellovibrio sp. 22V]